MLEWMYGLLVVAIIVAVVLAYFEAIDLFELIGGVLKLTAGLLFAVGAFFVWLVTRRRQESDLERPSDARRPRARLPNRDRPLRDQLSKSVCDGRHINCEINHSWPRR
jgi:hypothetical protein